MGNADENFLLRTDFHAEQPLLDQTVNQTFGTHFQPIIELRGRNEILIRHRTTKSFIVWPERSELSHDEPKRLLRVAVQRGEDSLCVVGQCALKFAQFPIVGPSEHTVSSIKLLSAKLREQVFKQWERLGRGQSRVSQSLVQRPVRLDIPLEAQAGCFRRQPDYILQFRPSRREKIESSARTNECDQFRKLQVRSVEIAPQSRNDKHPLTANQSSQDNDISLLDLS